MKEPLGFGRTGHVRSLSDQLDAVLDEVGRILRIDLVLGRAGEGVVRLDVPDGVRAVSSARDVCDPLVLLRVFADPAALDVLQLLDIGQLLGRDALLVVDHAAGVRERDDLRTEGVELLDRELGDVSGAGDQTCASFQFPAFACEYLVAEVYQTVSCRLGADQRAAEGLALSGEHAGEGVRDLLVLSEEEADLPSSDSDVACGDVGVRAYVPEQLVHEALAEPHDLCVALALGVEVAASFATSHGKPREAVLEHLLEGQELHDREVDRRVEAQASLVGAERGRLLHPEAAVDLETSLVIHPRHAEDDRPLGLHHALDDLVVGHLRQFVDDPVHGQEECVDGAGRHADRSAPSTGSCCAPCFPFGFFLRLL